MRTICASCFILALGFLAVPGWADDIAWRPAAKQSAPASANGAWNGAAQGTSNSAPIITLSRPVPIRSAAAAAMPDSGIQPVSFEQTPITRARADEVTYPAPLPIGPAPQLIQQPGKTEDIPIKPNLVPAPQMSNSFFGGDIIDGDCGGMDGSGCCDAFNPCCCMPRGRIWASAEYLLWNVKAANAPPLLTTSPQGTPLGVAGILGQPTTSDLWDKGNMPNGFRNGGRFTVGFWFPQYDNLGLEASYFFLGARNSNFSMASTGNPIMMRPFSDVVTGQPLAIATAYPGFAQGNFNVNTNSYLWGMELNLRKKLWCGPCGYLDLLGGYRLFQLQDGINITDIELAPGALPQPGLLVQDNFNTRNTFNGGQLGLDGQWNFWRRWFIGTTLKVALGDVHQVVNVSGATTTIPGGATVPGGVLALSSNSTPSNGVSHDRFAILPSSTLKLGYNINDHWRMWVGYDILFISSVARAGDQINLNINPRLIPGGNGTGPALPSIPFKTTDFWAQGASFGLEYRW